MSHDTAEHSRVPVVVLAPLFGTEVAFRASCGLLTGWQTSEIHIQNQESLVLVLMVDGLSFAYIDGSDCRT